MGTRSMMGHRPIAVARVAVATRTGGTNGMKMTGLAGMVEVGVPITTGSPAVVAFPVVLGFPMTAESPVATGSRAATSARAADHSRCALAGRPGAIDRTL